MPSSQKKEVFLKEKEIKKQDTKIRRKLAHRQKIFRFSLLFIGVVIAVCVGMIAYSFKDIFHKNQGWQAPFFRFFQQVEPAHLRGEGDGRINFLILGYAGGNHPGTYLTDTIIVASIDPYNKKCALLSIPRDLYVPLPTGGYGKINAAYSLGKSNEKEGLSGEEFVKKTVNFILDLPIHYYLSVNFEGFRQAIDLVGGVDVYVEKDIYDPYFPDGKGGNMVYQIKKGWHHFNGEEALQYARSRYTTSDFDRARRQQKIILALKDKMTSLGLWSNPTKVAQLLNALASNVHTDLTAEEIVKTFELIKDLGEDEIATKVLDSSPQGLLYADRVNGAYVLKPRDPSWEGIRALVHSIFIEPFLEKEQAEIIVENGAGVNGLAFKVANFLKARGYKVLSYRTAKSLTATTKILDCSSGEKPYSLELLKKRFLQAQIVACSASVDKEADFVITLGQDFDDSAFFNAQI